MTTTRSPSSPGDTLPAAPLAGELLDAVAYAFSDSTTGTMSASVGAGDHQLNRTSMADRLMVHPQDVVWMDQEHGATVVDPGALGPDVGGNPPRCDAMVTAAKGTALAVLVADCVPVLLASTAGVGVAHAGRAGVILDVAGTAVRRLRLLPGGEHAPVHAVIGPAIGACCYEVPDAMAAEVDDVLPGTASQTTWGTASLDLVAGVVDQLRAAGVSHIRRAGECTRCGGAGRWFSHRASGAVEQRPAGRQAGLIVRRTAARP